MNITISQELAILAAFQAFLFAAYLIFSNISNLRSSKYIALLLVLLGINMINEFLIYYLDPIHPNISIFINTTFFFMPASLYFYTKSSLLPGFRLKKTDIMHLTPFVAINIFLIPTVYILNLEENPATTDFHYAMQKGFYIFFYFLLFLYLLLTVRFLRQSKELYFENFSNTNIRRYKYLYDLSIIFIVLFSFSAIKNFMVYGLDLQNVEFASNLMKLLLLIFFCWIIFKGLQSPELFRDSEEKLIAVKELLKGNDDNISDSSINEKKLDEIISFMNETEAFLDPDLSINKLARKLKMQSRELSLLINHNLKKHFFDFINEFRIEKAKLLLADPTKKDLTVLEILYEVGFNSKSSFNTAFKKQCGLTPTQYRINHSISNIT